MGSLGPTAAACISLLSHFRVRPTLRPLPACITDFRSSSFEGIRLRRHSASVVLAIAVFQLFLAFPATVEAQSVLPNAITDAERPRVTAVAVAGPIQVDGRLDEATWRGPSLGGFIQAEPREGQPASEDTDVWVAYDSDNLYVAAYIHDSQDPTVSDIRKDFADSNQDVFQVILDTFRDRRSGFVFQTNAEGARGDRQVANEGREINASWDAIWRVETQRVADGWTLEMEIPFRALRFDPAGEAWGINFGRNLRRNNEVSYWAPIPRAYTFNRVVGRRSVWASDHVSGAGSTCKAFCLGEHGERAGREWFYEPNRRRDRREVQAHRGAHPRRHGES